MLHDELLTFSSDYRFQGLRVPSGMNSLWFYSIQGVFRVAFELYSRQQQLSILESFQVSQRTFIFFRVTVTFVFSSAWRYVIVF